MSVAKKLQMEFQKELHAEFQQQKLTEKKLWCSEYSKQIECGYINMRKVKKLHFKKD